MSNTTSKPKKISIPCSIFAKIITSVSKTKKDGSSHYYIYQVLVTHSYIYQEKPNTTSFLLKAISFSEKPLEITQKDRTYKGTLSFTGTSDVTFIFESE